MFSKFRNSSLKHNDHNRKNLSTLNLFLLVIVISFTMVSCRKEDQITPLPQGLQNVTGIISKAELSFTRRGTHLLLIDNVPLYYLESTTVNLGNYENELVSLLGYLEKNTNEKGLPVLVVKEVIEKEGGKTKKWILNEYGISFEAPKEWRSFRSQDSIQFIVEGETKPLLTIYSEENEEVGEGFPVMIDGIRSLRSVDEKTGSETIYIKRKNGSILTIMFTPKTDTNLKELKTQWLVVLRSIKLKKNGNQDVTKPPTGTGSLLPCGGTAGILCPPGYICDITDLNENIGVCKKM